MEDLKAEISKQTQSLNLCDTLDSKSLTEIGVKVIEWFDEDVGSRREWKEKNDRWMKLATQVVERKTYPWPDSANVKYPLLTTAAMQFAARAYPALVPGPRLVNGLVIGEDQQGLKAGSAQRVGRHMSYQLLWEMKGWEEDMDKLCLMLPIVGCLFKKTYYDEVKKTNCSELISPNDLVIDYYAKSVESATRKAHVIYKTRNEISERVRKGLFRDVDLRQQTSLDEDFRLHNQISGMEEPKISAATPYKLIECHCWWDLDGDDYDEPYVITIDYNTKQVLRIVTRFEMDGVETDEKGKVTKITPTEYFTKFGFIPNPDGSIYDLGFGLLLGGINETVNTLTNQLLDSGTLNNLQAGFLGRGIRVRGGNTRFIPGEWKPVDFSGDDIKKHIFPLPTKEPSDVLFKLLETLVTSGKELASVAEIFVGKMPGQNTPATTTMATIEQGLKVFTAIYKRIYRALGEEYEKLFKLNGIYIDDKVFFTINEPQGANSQSVYRTDYQSGVSVKPNADPNIVSSAQKLMKVQAMGPLLQLGTINPLVYTKRYLEAIDEENISELMGDGQGKPYQAPPSPEQQQIQGEMQISQADAMNKKQQSDQKMQLEQMKAALKQQSDKMDMAIKAAEAQIEERKSMMEMMHTQMQSNQQMHQQHQQHIMDLNQQHEKHVETLKQNSEMASAKAEAARKAKPAQGSSK